MVLPVVNHWFELRIPIADEIAYHLADVLMGVEDVDRTTFGAPHLRIQGTAILAIPPEG